MAEILPTRRKALINQSTMFIKELTHFPVDYLRVTPLFCRLLAGPGGLGQYGCPAHPPHRGPARDAHPGDGPQLLLVALQLLPRGPGHGVT